MQRRRMRNDLLDKAIASRCLERSTLTVNAAAALLAGCGGSQPPTDALGAMPQSRAGVRVPHPRHCRALRKLAESVTLALLGQDPAAPNARPFVQL